jgi:hypothetical protein
MSNEAEPGQTHIVATPKNAVKEEKTVHADRHQKIYAFAEQFNISISTVNTIM